MTASHIQRFPIPRPALHPKELLSWEDKSIVQPHGHHGCTGKWPERAGQGFRVLSEPWVKQQGKSSTSVPQLCPVGVGGEELEAS